MNDFPETASEAPARFHDAVARVDGDVSLLREMAAMTAPEFGGLIDQAKNAIADSAFDDAIRALHKLKGMLSTFDSDGVVVGIQDIIQAARSKQSKTMSLLMSQHEREIVELVAEIRRFADG